MDIALDVAATHFFEGGRYVFEGRRIGAAGMARMLGRWIPRYGITSIEDPLAEDDWAGLAGDHRRLGAAVRLVGDDLFVDESRAPEPRDSRRRGQRGAGEDESDRDADRDVRGDRSRARKPGYGAVISARSGETEDSFLADLAVASGAGQIKIGSVTRSERLAKYNRLLEIEKWEITSG